MRRGASTAVVLATALGWVKVAAAQESGDDPAPVDVAPEPDAAPDGAASPAAPPERVIPLGPVVAFDPLDDTMVWRPTGPDGARAFTDVAYDAAVRVAAAITEAGELWVSTDGGYAWRPVLAPLYLEDSGDEELLLDLETRMEELVEDLDLPEDVPLEALGDDAQLVIDALQADLQDGFAVRSLESTTTRTRPRVWVAADGRVVVAREDGLWTSSDRGQAWRRVLDEPALAWAEGRGVEVVGGVGRLWRLVPGRPPELTRLDDPEEVVRDVVDTGADFVAATSAGGLRSVDGRVWGERVQQEPALVAAPDGAGGAWLMGLVDGEGGELVEVIDLAPSGGRLVRVGAGALELSDDRAGTWRPVTEPPAWPMAVAWAPDAMIVATIKGLYRLVSLREVESGGGDAWIPVETLLAAAERRVGVQTAGDRLGPRGQVTMWMLPDVTFTARYGRGGGLHSGLDAGLDGAREADLQAWVTFVWRPPVGTLIAANALVTVDEDGSPQAYLGATDSFMGLGRVERRAALHRQAVATEIVEAWRRRRDLVREIDTPRAGRSVHDVVTLKLRVAEIEAWLDVLTDGAVRRFGHGDAGGGG